MRLTKKTGYFNENPIYSVIAEPKEVFIELNKSVQKLGQLEDIEEELGIDLITLVKASKGIVVYNESKTAIEIDVIPTIDLLNKRFIVWSGDIMKPYKTLYFKDYGKTWALSKEELL